MERAPGARQSRRKGAIVAIIFDPNFELSHDGEALVTPDPEGLAKLARAPRKEQVVGRGLAFLNFRVVHLGNQYFPAAPEHVVVEFTVHATLASLHQPRLKGKPDLAWYRGKAFRDFLALHFAGFFHDSPVLRGPFAAASAWILSGSLGDKAREACSETVNRRLVGRYLVMQIKDDAPWEVLEQLPPAWDSVGDGVVAFPEKLPRVLLSALGERRR